MRSLQLRSRLMLSGIQIAKVQTVHNSRPRRIGRAGTGLGWRKSGKQLGEKTLVKVGASVPRMRTQLDYGDFLFG